MFNLPLLSLLVDINITDIKDLHGGADTLDQSNKHLSRSYFKEGSCALGYYIFDRPLPLNTMKDLVEEFIFYWLNLSQHLGGDVSHSKLLTSKDYRRTNYQFAFILRLLGKRLALNTSVLFQ